MCGNETIYGDTHALFRHRWPPKFIEIGDHNFTAKIQCTYLPPTFKPQLKPSRLPRYESLTIILLPKHENTHGDQLLKSIFQQRIDFSDSPPSGSTYNYSRWKSYGKSSHLGGTPISIGLARAETTQRFRPYNAIPKIERCSGPLPKSQVKTSAHVSLVQSPIFENSNIYNSLGVETKN